MKPVVFDGCFGWLHPAHSSTGVVLCNPFGYDALCTHRSWRKLAARLAAAGLPTLRFDYPGTGDAAGFEEDPGRFGAWLAAIEAAVSRLRAWTGVERVALVGVRFGATLAALAAQRLGNIDSIVLLAPPVTGRRYLRELRAHRTAWMSTPAGANAAPIADDEQYAEAFGFGIHGVDIAQVGAIDMLGGTRTPARRVLLLDSTGTNLIDKLAQHYESLGAEVERGDFEESDRFFLEPLMSEEPTVAFGRVVKWLAQSASPATRAAPSAALPEPVMTLAHGASERPVTFGQCFGIACEPDAPRQGAPAVLLICTGASHHIGDGRFLVLVARRLAALGIASLRMDLRGQGDSTLLSDEITLDSIYAQSSREDAGAGAQWLAARGHARVVAFGVCGGAFASVQACASHPNIAAGYAVNLQKFVWHPSDEPARPSWFASMKASWHAVLTGEKLLRAPIDSVSNSPLVMAREMTRRVLVRSWFASKARRALRRVAFAGRDWLARTRGRQVSSSETRALLHSIQKRNAHLRLVYGELDRGLEEARVQLGASLGALRSLPNIQVNVIPKLDHALYTREARAAVMHDLVDWLQAEFALEDELERGAGRRAAPRCIGSPARG
ncbi:alpha/beta fold hydrolase [Burkholderia sp. Ax-1719]|uniref:serine aminopeptidase domain-containing protein n=1 Tax=Burkholderia sp. Ax-1719 TaxID=2608334 RepID=UPI001423A3FB|nr:alpha/beta fold hydrolase [Burkholderia sp. Ax-1719]NIE65522.1 alpha/beta hydrolase [Burkholderia sp. Ax-1719]